MKPKASLIIRVKEHLSNCGAQIQRAVSWRHPNLYAALRWPLQRPWQKKHLTLRPPGGGIGDEIMASIIIAEVKRQNPDCHVTLVSRYPALWEDVSEIDQVIPANKDNLQGLSLFFGHMLPPPRNLPTIIAEQIGLRIEKIRLLAPAPKVSEEFKQKVAALPKPRIVIQPEASGFTPNKEWPRPYWEKLLNDILPLGTVVEVGKDPYFQNVSHANFQSLAGKTSVAEFAYLVSQSDLVLCPVSGGMHLAEAYGVKSIVIFGGYEKPEGHPYPLMTPFYTPLSCAPCWRLDQCPYSLKCMADITVESVVKSVKTALQPADD